MKHNGPFKLPAGSVTALADATPRQNRMQLNARVPLAPDDVAFPLCINKENTDMILTSSQRTTLTALLNISSSDLTLILFDRFGLDLAHAISDAFTTDSHPYCAVFIPIATQQSYAAQGIPSYSSKILSESTVLVTCLSDAPSCTPFRRMILDIACRRPIKILHLPGVTFPLFKNGLNTMDHVALSRDAELLRQRLNTASIVNVLTRSRDGASHSLTFSVASRPVHTDEGILAPAMIMQLPTGEVYVAPQEDTATGTLALNGSALGLAFTKRDSVVLHFRKGLLVFEECAFSTTPRSEQLHRELRDLAAVGHVNITLGEFGIGINRQLRGLTGSELHDEKVFGHAHVALGCNSVFGGSIADGTHSDLVFTPSSVRIDDIPLEWPWGDHRRGGR